MAKPEPKMNFREAILTVERDADGKPTCVRASVSSECEVPHRCVYDAERDTWECDATEILGHGEGEVDFSRMKDGLVIQDNHGGDQIGLIRKPELKDGKLGGVIEFCSGERAQCIKRDAEAGLRRNMSVGYMVAQYKSCGTDKNGKRAYRAVRWIPFEASFVNVPADTSVGVGRSLDQNKAGVPAAVEGVQIMDKPKEERAALSANEISEAYRLASSAHKKPGEADEAIRGGAEKLAEFRSACLSVIEKIEAERSAAPAKPALPEPASVRKLDESDKKEIKKRYSISRALRHLADPSVDAGFEVECSREIEKAVGRAPQGLFIPDCVSAKRSVTPGSFQVGDGNGSNFVQTSVLFGELIEALKDRLVLAKAGMRVLSGLTGDIAIPKSGEAAGGWILEGANAPASTPTLGQVAGTPHTAAAYCDISRKMMIQSGIAPDAFITGTLLDALASVVETAGLVGTGTAGAPTGIAATANIGTVAFTAGAPTRANLLAAISAVMTANADVDAMKWIMQPAVWALLAGTLDWTAVKNSDATVSGITSGKYLLDTVTKTCEGYGYLTTNLAPAKKLLFGDFAQVVMGVWSGTDVKVDPYTLSLSGATRVVVMQDVDFMVRQPKAFVIGNTVLA